MKSCQLRMKVAWFAFIMCVALNTLCATVWGQTLAFPEAEGFGRFAQGGRGGQVIEVTNLNDSGTGSLRAAVEASGARTVIFRVGGTIEITSDNNRLRVMNPYLTIAGQTAPGDGILIRGGMLDVQTHDVIVRHLRIRPGPVAAIDAAQVFAVQGEIHDVIFDHVSMSWSTDEAFSVFSSLADVHNVTLQWSILSESLDCSTHPEGCHSKGLLVGASNLSEVSIHHNLLSHHQDRNPLLSSGNVDFVNIIIYNWGFDASGCRTDRWCCSG